MANDAVINAKLSMKGYKVVRITAQELKDEAALSVHFQILAVYLGH